MKRGFQKTSIITGITSLILALAGYIMQSLKGTLDVDTMTSTSFDLVMTLYKTGNSLITAAICIAIVAFVCWTIHAILPIKK